MSISSDRSARIQILRGIAIICVIMIHTAPPGMAQVFIRPFINMCVETFLFLSGYLTLLPAEKIGGGYTVLP